MRAGSLFPPLSMLEQTSEKSLPDRLISGCSGVLFGPVLAGEQTKPVLAREQIRKSASSTGTRSRLPCVYFWFLYCLHSSLFVRVPALALFVRLPALAQRAHLSSRISADPVGTSQKSVQA